MRPYRSSTLKLASLIAFVLSMGIAALCQQLGTAILNGIVTDPQGAVVKMAQVTTRQNATGLERMTSTNSEGVFVFNDLAPGRYDLRVQAKGLAGFDTPVLLEVGQQAKIKVVLGVEATQTTVDVQAERQEVDTLTSVVDGVVDSHQIDNLPLNGRNFLELALLMPGNTIAPNFDPTKANTVVISSAGQLGRGGNVSIDGMDDNDDVVGGMLLNVPEDAVQEFQVATQRFSAELGRSASSVVNVVTKSGTNALHGSASIYERDKSLQALPATFDPANTGGETPPFRRQQYSGTLGGPIVADRAWWFGGFEYRDEIGGLLVATRHPNATGGGGGTISNNFAREPLSDPIGTLRGDWQMSDRDRLNLHYGIQRQDATGVTPFLSGQPIGSGTERQDSRNNFQAFQASWTRVLSPTVLNRASFSFNNFINTINPTNPGPELDFPSLAGGASYDSPQGTRQKRLQWDDGIDWVRGKHNLHLGGEFQRIDADFDLGVFRCGAVEFVQNFANKDRNGDGVINDQDLLFAVAIRSGTPDKDLIIPNADNNFIAGYFQDDWRVHPQLTLNLGLRYEIDTDVNNVGHYNQVNPILAQFFHGNRHKDANNFGPRVGFNWATKSGTFSVHGGYGIYYDRVTLEIVSLERGLDGRALPINVTVGNASFLDNNGNFISGQTPTYSNPFSGPVIPGAGGASEGINIIDNKLQNPMVQQFNLGFQSEFVKNWTLKVDGIHDLGTHFIIGVPLGTPPQRPETVTDLQSTVNTHYDALWVTVDHRFAQRFQFHSAYTLSKSLDYANYDQIPFGYPPVDPNNLRREYGSAPNDQRHRLVLQGILDLPWRLRLSPLWTYGSSVPMDILLGDGSGKRVPEIGRNAGGRQFHTAAELNAFIAQINANGAVNGAPLPLVSPRARFGDTYNSFDLRLSKDFRLSERFTLQAIAESFNLFNKTNILGTSKNNYSGFFNALVPDSNNPALSSAFGTPVSQAGGIFGSGGPRAFQLAAKLTF